MLNMDGDLGRHITIGNYIRSHRQIPLHDVFSHTMAGEPLIPHEWLAQLTFSIVNTYMGLNGMIFLTALLIALTFTLTYRQMRKQNVYRILALLLTVLAAYASSLHWLPRPHIYTLLFTALWAYLLENEKSKLELFPLIMFVWANTHGAFIAGFAILGGHMAGWLWEYLQKQATWERGRKLALIGGFSFAVTFINPAGWRLWDTSVGYLGNRYLVDHTREYFSPNFHEPGTWPFLLLMVVGILAFGFGRRMRPHKIFLFAGWSAMSLYSARNIPLFSIVATPFIGLALQTLFEKSRVYQNMEDRLWRIEKDLKGGLLPSLAFILVMFLFPPVPSAANQFNANIFPVEAVNWLQLHPQKGEMFNYFTWGGYLLYRLWPEKTVFIDGQTDFYGESLTREYAQVITMEDGWFDTLKKHNVSWVIIPADQLLGKGLQEQEGWNLVYQDHTAVILHEP